jgi:SAM-dependent methyltransferase
MASEQPPRPAKLDAEHFDHWYASMAASSARNAIVARNLGLPPGLLSTGTTTWLGLAEVTGALRLPRDGLLVDAACGFGGYGIEVARRSGARLLGVDFSEVALEQARVSSAEVLPAGRAEFLAGTLTATGLPAGAADGLMCLDSVQLADPPLAALLEFRRVLAPGARLVLTSWEAVAASDERVAKRIRAMSLERDLPAAGFTDVRVRTGPTGARPSSGCGRTSWPPSRPTTMTRGCSRPRARAGARWRSGTRCAASSRPRPRRDANVQARGLRGPAASRSRRASAGLVIRWNVMCACLGSPAAAA